MENLLLGPQNFNSRSHNENHRFQKTALLPWWITTVWCCCYCHSLNVTILNKAFDHWLFPWSTMNLQSSAKMLVCTMALWVWYALLPNFSLEACIVDTHLYKTTDALVSCSVSQHNTALHLCGLVVIELRVR